MITSRLREAGRIPLVRHSIALIVNTGLNGVLGFVYWLAAARLYPASIVGTGAAAISGLLLAASIGWTGLQYALMRFLPASGGRSTRLVLFTYAAALAIALPAALAFLVYAAGTRELRPLSDSAGGILGFVGAVAIWAVFSLQDAALIGLRRSVWVPLENAVYGALKLALLVLLAFLASSWGLLISWVAGAAALVIVVNALLFGRVLAERRGQPDRLPGTRQIVGFAAGHHLVALVAALPDTLVPLLILGLLSERDNAYYYAAWTVSYSLRLVVMNIANALTVEGAHDTHAFEDLIRSSVRLGLAVLTPVLVGTLLLADIVMALFGDGYRSAALLLRLFALSLVPFAVVTLFIVTERIGQRVRGAAVVVAVSTGVTVLLDVVLVPRLGIDGAGIGWLVAQLAAAVTAAAIVVLRHSRDRARRPGHLLAVLPTGLSRRRFARRRPTRATRTRTG